MSDSAERNNQHPTFKESSERERAIAQALADYLDELSQVETVDIDTFCKSHPEIENELRPLLEALNQMDDPISSSTHPGVGDAARELPKTLSGHRIIGEIGTGGMGRVLLGSDDRLGRKVAIKTLRLKYRDNQSLRTRFMQEARALARISHPNIVQIFSLGQPDEAPHFVMEFVEGSSLIEAGRTLTMRQKAALMQKVALAVDFLHDHQILHRDLKPTNIMVSPDLKPKILDFGLARYLENDETRITLPGEIVGTPDYFSPEHTVAGLRLDRRSDVFSLGTILYELLTGSVPFHSDSFGEQMRKIREAEPILPRRRNAEVPGELQDICLKALEKNPENRYASAREMADDLERYLAGEKVHAAPTAYATLITGKIEQHIQELEGWRQDEILSENEFDSFRKSYGRLIEREDAWILEARRLTLPQVTLYLGAWILTVGAALLFLFQFVHLPGKVSVGLIAGAAGLTAWSGLRLWKKGQLRVGIAFLLTFCLLLPIVLLLMMIEYRIAALPSPHKEWELLVNLEEPFRAVTNAQLWWAVLLAMPACGWLRRFTHSSVFSLMIAAMGVAFSLVTLLRLGWLEWAKHDPGWFYFRMLPVALVFFVTAFTIERMRFPNDSRYFYPIGVVFTLIALTGLAAQHQPYRQWLEATFPWTRGQLEYLFFINATIYVALQAICDRFPSPQMRGVAKAFRFVIPGHILTSLLFLWFDAYGRWQDDLNNLVKKRETRILEFLLPTLACLFIFGSIRKQMKNYFVSGMAFLAIGIVIWQYDLFESQSRWPIALLLLGSLLMVVATRYSAIKMALAGLVRRRA
jgi:serine/threonine protein kinase